MTARAAIVLAAGKGTRMKSGLAKVLHEANGRPLAYYPIRAALESGADPVIAVVGYQGGDVRDRLAALFPDAPLRFATQEKQLGTAHAVLAARRALSRHRGRVLVLYGDVPLIQTSTLATLARAGRRSPVAFVTMHPADPTGYGRIVRDGRGRPRAIVEHRDAGPEERAMGECNAGLYDCDAAFLWKALGRVGRKNAQGELYLTDLVAMAYEAGTPAVAVQAPMDEVSGVNDRVELAAAARVLRRRRLEVHMRAGVTVIDPEATYVEDSVTLGVDVVLEPGTFLAGSTALGPGVRVGTGSRLTDAIVGAGTTIHPYTVIDSSRVGARCELGPFARLRPGTELADEVRLGNFVETKKTRMGRGSKANHLSYLGDATVGARTNIGAGTITCNYDGVSKFPTVLGDDVFIGSDTQLVAPVTVGPGAYVGAGSTIVRDVPPGALALSRPEQVIKEGWVARRKKGLPSKGKKMPAVRNAARRARR